MEIYNTLSEKKERLEKPRNQPLKLFVCGPTVYDAPHLGHGRVGVFFDFVKGYLESRGYKIKYLQNITDIDDKIIERAKEKNKTPREIAGFYEKEYFKAMKMLEVDSVDKYPRASQHIKQIITQIKRLWDKGLAYKTSSGVYFEVKKFPEYGKLSKQNLDELRPGWRIEPDQEKKDSLDFALWKFKKYDYEPSWPSPWGDGRPGWHIEDTAITEKYFGSQYDLHGGGMDLKFPHHESEIAQQEASSGLKPFVKIWMHIGFLTVNGEKMSKSLKNFITINDFLNAHSPSVFRLIVFQHHYRSPLDYRANLAMTAKSTLNSLAQFLAKLKMSSAKLARGVNLDQYESQFHQKMEDDFNTPAALSVIFNLINEINPKIFTLAKKEARAIEKWVLGKLKLFKIKIQMPKIPSKIKKLAAKRQLLRTRQQFIQADALRKNIESLGYTIEDTMEGFFLWSKNNL